MKKEKNDKIYLLLKKNFLKFFYLLFLCLDVHWFEFFYFVEMEKILDLIKIIFLSF